MRQSYLVADCACNTAVHSRLLSVFSVFSVANEQVASVRHHLPVNTGLRFSVNASIASRESS